MIIPLAADVPEDRRPAANWLVIMTCVLVYAAELLTATETSLGPLQAFVLDRFDAHGLLGYMWLHAINPLHLLANIISLWVFGNAVCAKIGNFRFTGLYVLFGLISGLCHLAFTNQPVLGASGAINGVVGMYLVFFPRNSINCLLAPLPVRFTLSGWRVVVFWLICDLLGMLAGGTSVAYWSHLSGIAAGFAAAVVMLRTGAIVMERHEESILEIVRTTIVRLRSATACQSPPWQAVGLGDSPKCKPKRQDKFSSAANPGRTDGSRDTTAKCDSVLIKFACVCGREIQVLGKYAGQKGRCPACGDRVTVPLPGQKV